MRNLPESFLSSKKERWVDQDQSLNLKNNTTVFSWTHRTLCNGMYCAMMHALEDSKKEKEQVSEAAVCLCSSK